MQAKLHISGMSCLHCLRRIAAARQELAGCHMEQTDVTVCQTPIKLTAPLFAPTLPPTAEATG